MTDGLPPIWPADERSLRSFAQRRVVHFLASMLAPCAVAGFTGFAFAELAANGIDAGGWLRAIEAGAQAPVALPGFGIVGVVLWRLNGRKMIVRAARRASSQRRCFSCGYPLASSQTVGELTEAPRVRTLVCPECSARHVCVPADV